jgi:hypothetical protein
MRLVTIWSKRNPNINRSDSMFYFARKMLYNSVHLEQALLVFYNSRESQEKLKMLVNILGIT